MIKKERNKRPTKKANQAKQRGQPLAVIRTETFANIMRFFLYAMIIFIFTKGVVASVRRSPEEELIAAQKQFIQNIDNDTARQVALSTFSEGFIKNYCTYAQKGEENYVKRLEPYTGVRLAGDIGTSSKFVDEADAVYTQTLDIAQITSEQYDVTVMVDVIYTKYQNTSRVVAPEESAAITDEGLNPFSQKQTMFYKVPVFYKNNKCIVEGIPIITVQPKPAEYAEESVRFIEITDDAKKKEIQILVNDFTKALFEESQNKINYYLSDVTSIENFEALKTNVKYEGIQDFNVHEITTDKYLALVTIKTKDINGSAIKQRFALLIVQKDRYLVEDLLLRTHNLNI